MSDDWGSGFDSFSNTGNNGSNDFASSDSFADSFGGFGTSPVSQPPTKTYWYIPMTLCSLLSGGLAILLAFLFQNVERNVPLFALSFAAPSCLLLLLILFLENRFAPMNPSYSRKAQRICALVMAACIFVLGSVGEFVHEYVAVKPQDYIIILDKSGSMTEANEEACNNAITKLLTVIPMEARVGFITFSSTVDSEIPMAFNTAEQQSKIKRVMNEATGGGTNFYFPLSLAMSFIRNPEIKTHVLMLTDGSEGGGDDSLGNNKNYLEIKQLCETKNVRFSCIGIDTYLDESLENLVAATGGASVTVNNEQSLYSIISDMNYVAKSQDLYHEENADTKDSITRGIIQLLESLILGVGLTLMLSRQRQKRFQLILSPLLGIAAFVFMQYGNDILNTSLEPWLLEGISRAVVPMVFMKNNP